MTDLILKARVAASPATAYEALTEADALRTFKPGRTLVFSWGSAGMVRWELADSGGKTALTFVQSGFEHRPSDVSGWAGWLSGIAELRRMHEFGDAWKPLTRIERAQ